MEHAHLHTRKHNHTNTPCKPWLIKSWTFHFSMDLFQWMAIFIYRYLSFCLVGPRLLVSREFSDRSAPLLCGYQYFHFEGNFRNIRKCGSFCDNFQGNKNFHEIHDYDGKIRAIIKKSPLILSTNRPWSKPYLRIPGNVSKFLEVMLII